MSNADVHGFDALERDLRLALAWEPSAGAIARIDRRVAAAVARTAPAATTLWPRRHLRIVLLVAAALALMGATITLSLLQQAAELMPGWRVAYAQGQILNLSKTVNGYTVALERGYVDPNQLVSGSSSRVRRVKRERFPEAPWSMLRVGPSSTPLAETSRLTFRTPRRRSAATRSRRESGAT